MNALNGPVGGERGRPRVTALAAAARLTVRTGALHSVSELETEAQVSRGTAAALRKTLRDDDPSPTAPRTAATDDAQGSVSDQQKDIQP